MKHTGAVFFEIYLQNTNTHTHTHTHTFIKTFRLQFPPNSCILERKHSSEHLKCISTLPTEHSANS